MNRQLDFAKQMDEARKNKIERRNRGESFGDCCGTQKPRLPRRPDCDMEFGLMMIVDGLAGIYLGLEQDLVLIVAELNDATFDQIPF